MPKCDLFEVALQHGCSTVNLLHIFRAPFLKNTSRRLLLNNACVTILWTLNIIESKYLKCFGT